jgi:hypothetical protein
VVHGVKSEEGAGSTMTKVPMASFSPFKFKVDDEKELRAKYELM